VEEVLTLASFGENENDALSGFERKPAASSNWTSLGRIVHASGVLPSPRRHRRDGSNPLAS
jgi:hypothetical protein